jgi:hypothetical protein
MSFLPKMPNLPGSLGSHAVSMAANARDGLRAAHYFVQELASADDPAGPGQQRKKPTWLLPADAPTSLITGFIAQNARIADKMMNWSSDAATALLAPDWRVLPSPFNRNMMREIAQAIGSSQGFASNALFNAYFYRAAVHILGRYSRPPYLVLENRIDAARRALAAEQPDGGIRESSDTAFMARALIALVRAAPVVEAGAIDPKSVLAKTRDPNAGIAAVAGVALLLGDLGKPTDEIDEDQFFAVVAALISPRLAAIEHLVLRDDTRKLETELAAIKALY